MASPGRIAAHNAARASKVAELAADARRAIPAPPPPPPIPSATPAKQWRHPMEEQWDRRVHDFNKRVASLTPPPEGTTRLFRAGAIPSDSPPRSLSDRIVGPFGSRMTRAELDAAKGAAHANPFEAEGRWFTNRPDELDFYIRENDTSPVYYVDVPADRAAEFSVSKTPFAKNSRNPEYEFVLPTDMANSSIRLLEGLKAK